MGELWTVAEAASWLKKSVSWVYRNSAAGKLPSHKVGGELRFIQAELQEWLMGAVEK